MKPRGTLLALALLGAVLAPATAAQAGTQTPAIHLSTSQGRVGSRLTVTGHGFPGGKAVAVRFHGSVGGAAQLASTRSRSDGTLSVTFHVPADPQGAHAVFATFSDHRRSDTAWFRIVPHLNLTPTRAAPADTICVQTGLERADRYTVRYALSGYPANTPVAIALVPRLGGPRVRARLVTTGPRGSAVGTYTEPRVPSGNYLATTASGTSLYPASERVFSAWFTCYVFSGKARPMRWRADGVGFLPGSTVTVRWTGSRHNPIFTATVRLDGSWGGKLFTIACAKHPGHYTVTTTGSDGQGRPILATSHNRIRTSCG